MRLREHLHVAYVDHLARADRMAPLQPPGELGPAQLKRGHGQSDDKQVDDVDVHAVQRPAYQRQVLGGETEVVPHRPGRGRLLGEQRVGTYLVIDAIDGNGDGVAAAAQRLGQVPTVRRRRYRGEDFTVDPAFICRHNQLGVAKADVDTAHDCVHGRVLG